ncbi:MAG: hypothetical protein GXX99_02450 [Clostridiales bacterium]|nr:hypothetical protein [Clostridiales bacterium]
MQLVVWLGQDQTARRLAALLELAGLGCARISPGGAALRADADVLLLSGRVRLEEAPPYLLVVEAEAPAVQAAPPHPALILVEGGRTAGLQAVAGSGAPVITVGLSERDTVTYSSLAEGRCCIAVNRPFSDLLGRPILEQELTLRCGDAGLPELFLAASAMLLGISPERLAALNLPDIATTRSPFADKNNSGTTPSMI